MNAKAQRLHELTSRLCEDALSDSEFRELEVLVAAAPELRRRHLEILLLHGELQWSQGDGETIPLAGITIEAKPLTNNARIRSVAIKAYEFFKRPTPTSMTVAALVVGALLTAMAYIAAPIYSRLAQRPPADLAAPTFVANLVDMHDAEWATGQIGTTVGASLQQGQRMNLRQGLAEFQLRGGAQVVVEGPVIFVFDSPSQISLGEGQLTARVAADARGFAVATQAATFVDLGTEFGVDVRDGKAEAHVFVGAVEARVAQSGNIHRIEQGDGLIVDRDLGAAKRITANERRFVRRLPQWIPIDVVNASFEEPRLAADGEWRPGAAGWQNDKDGHFGVSRFGREFSQRVPDGEQLAFLNEGALSQTLSEKFAADQNYRLALWIGNRLGEFSQNYRVELWAGETELVASENGVQPPKGEFRQATLTFAASPQHAHLTGTPLKIVLRSRGSLATNTQNHFDLVRLWRMPPSRPASSP